MTYVEREYDVLSLTFEGGRLPTLICYVHTLYTGDYAFLTLDVETQVGTERGPRVEMLTGSADKIRVALLTWLNSARKVRVRMKRELDDNGRVWEAVFREVLV